MHCKICAREWVSEWVKKASPKMIQEARKIRQKVYKTERKRRKTVKEDEICSLLWRLCLCYFSILLYRFVECKLYECRTITTATQRQRYQWNNGNGTSYFSGALCIFCVCLGCQKFWLRISGLSVVRVKHCFCSAFSSQCFWYAFL